MASLPINGKGESFVNGVDKNFSPIFYSAIYILNQLFLYFYFLPFVSYALYHHFLTKFPPREEKSLKQGYSSSKVGELKPESGGKLRPISIPDL